MKKIILFMTIILLSTNSFTFQDLQSTLPSFSFEDHQGFLDAAAVTQQPIIIDEDNDMPDIQEYDQHVTDTAQALQPSTIEVTLQKMMGVVLVHYMSLRECAREYFSGISNFIAKWYYNLIK